MYIDQRYAHEPVPHYGEGSALWTLGVSTRPDLLTPSCCPACSSTHTPTAAPSSMVYLVRFYLKLKSTWGHFTGDETVEKKNDKIIRNIKI